MPGIAAYQLLGALKRDCAIQILKHLLVPNGVECGEISLSNKSPGLLCKPVGNHLLNPAVNSVIENLPLPGKTNLSYGEGPALLWAALPLRVSLAGLYCNLQSAHNPARIGEVYCSE